MDQWIIFNEPSIHKEICFLEPIVYGRILLT